MSSGHLLYARNGALFAVPFDPQTLEILGQEVGVIDDLAWSYTNGVAGYDVSDNGTLVYLKASEWRAQRRVVEVDRSGQATPVFEELALWAEPRYSPDGRWMAVTRDALQRQIWLYDLRRRVMTQLTRTGDASFSPVWAPDSRSLVYTTDTPVYDLYRVAVDGSGAEPLVTTPIDKLATSVSPDGRTLLFNSADSRDVLQSIPIGGDAAAPVNATSLGQRNAVFAPNGEWIAYEETGADLIPQVFIQAVAGGGGRQQVSAGGGDQPRWTKGGREIVYRNGAAVLAVSFDAATQTIGTPVELFRMRSTGRLASGRTAGYDVSPDGTRFLMVVPIDRPDARANVVVLNWLDELRERVPRARQ